MATLPELFAGCGRVLVPGVDDTARFEEPARGRPGRALLVVQPGSVDQLRELVRRAIAGRLRLVPQGANTGLVGASVPPADRPAVVVSLDRLAAAPRIDPVAATAVVDAGTRLSALNAAAAPFGLQLPVDLAADPSLGGMVSTNTGGSRVLRYGPMRHQLLAVEVVAADPGASVYGRVDGVRKDSRGVDPAQFVVGAGGTLGVVTRATVALSPLPDARETWWLALAEPAAAVALLRFLSARRPVALSAFEFVSPAALACTLAHPGAPPDPFARTSPAGAVLAEWSGRAADVAGLGDDLAAAAEAGLLADAVVVPPTTGWALRHLVPEALRRAGTVVGHDVSAPLGAVFDVRSEVLAAVGELAPHGELCEFGHVGDGGLHLSVLFRDRPPGDEQVARLRIAIDDIVARHGGSYSAEHGLGPVNAERWLATTPAVEQSLVRALKSVVDPHGLLGHPDHPYNRLLQETPHA